MEIRKIKEWIAAPFTPMKDDGEINPGLTRHITKN